MPPSDVNKPTAVLVVIRRRRAVIRALDKAIAEMDASDVPRLRGYAETLRVLRRKYLLCSTVWWRFWFAYLTDYFRYLRLTIPITWRAVMLWNVHPDDVEEFLARRYPLEWNRAEQLRRKYE